MNINTAHFPPHAFRFQSGGGASGGSPIIAAPPAAAASATSTEIIQAKQQARLQAKAKMGINSTIVGGNLINPAAPSQSGTPGGNSKLGTG